MELSALVTLPGGAVTVPLAPLDVLDQEGS
jgi:hypothetical protein